jgi:hypothetical protein
LLILLTAVIVLSKDTVGAVQLVGRFVSATVVSIDRRVNSHLPAHSLALCSIQ